IKGGLSKEIIVTYTPTASEIVDEKIIIKSDKTDGDNELEINAIGNEPIPTDITSIVFEAEDNFETARNSGTKGDVKVSEDTSPLLGKSKAVQIYDKGDIVKINFNIPSNGKYQIKVRLRSGSLTGSTAYWPNGYNIKLNGASSGFIGDLESVSQKDDNFGGSYWGDMVLEWINLEKGVNFIEVEALTYWGVVDYIEVIGDNLPDQTIELFGDLSFGSLDVQSSLSKTLTITNSGTNILKIEKLSFSTPEFSGNWSGEIAGGSSQNISVVFSPPIEGTFEGTVEVISDAVNGNVSLGITGEGVVQKPLSQRLEAEKWFEVVGEFGSKAPIIESNGTSSKLSNDKAVQIYDKGDELRIPFNIEKSDKYFIRVRLRSGNTNSKTAYWPTGYEFKVDGVKHGFIGDESSISSKDNQFGISYWGTMESDMMEFSKGVHYLNVSAILSWGLVDFIEIIHESESSKRNGGSLGDASSITLGESNVELTVFPNPTADVVYFEMDIKEQNAVGEWIILNTNGKIVYRKELFSGQNSETVSLRNFGPGLYFTILNVNGNKISRKILVK
ncbi:MAG: choice-of-anchor D domain-containing protein, partial [Flammeovirgaceae bacterium]|nr:choice-of-anchor D domain-containing protein [Flammeovirgaceae bacterium]